MNGDGVPPKASGGPGDPSSVVFDIGYQRYAGPREGRDRARLAVYKDGVRKALGIGRGAKAKLLPWAFIALMAVIAVVMAVTAGAAYRLFEGGEGGFPPGTSHEFYYDLTIRILFVFAALVAPRLLCPDRRNGTLHLYLVRPLTSTDYVEARWAAFFTVMVLAAWLPQLVLLVGRVLGHPDPVAYLGSDWIDTPKFLLAGAALAAAVTTVAMLAAGLAARRGYASVLLIALYVIPGTVTTPLSFMTQLEWVSVFNLGEVLKETNALIFSGAEPAVDAGTGVEVTFGGEAPSGSGQDGEASVDGFGPLEPPTLSTTLLLFAYFGWFVAPGGILWMYYRRLTP